jgi:outer membrane protein assembly factor BamD
MHKSSIYLLILALSAFTGACANKDTGLSALDTEQKLYEDARRLMEKNRYDLAITRLRLINEQFPFGVYAEQAEIESLFALHSLGQHEETQQNAENILLRNPQHPQASYILYIQGQSAYHSLFGFLKRFFKTDVSQRDLSDAHKAYDVFAALMRDFPDNPYQDTVRQQMLHLRNIFARHELIVANYYLKRRAWLSANRRAQNIITNHEGYPQTDDALAIMVHSYRKLGLNDLAEDSLKVLRTNYPDYPSLNRRGEFIGAPRISGRSAFYKATIGQIIAPGMLFDTR